MNWAVVTSFIAVIAEEMIFIMSQTYEVVIGIFNHLLVHTTTAITLHNIQNNVNYNMLYVTRTLVVT